MSLAPGKIIYKWMKRMLIMKNQAKLHIYKGIIQYLLDTTRYSLKSIASLSDSSIKNIRAIYCDEQIPPDFSSGLQLVKLYHVILEIHETQTKE